MELWNEYEGRTVAGTFPLQRLIRPEGRSAFFTTATESGQGTVIRLIEAHYDEDEILARWRAVSQLKQDNLLALHKFGHVLMDDTSLLYAVIEPSDADLGQVLRERALTAAETRQLAVSLVAALQDLHAIGLVHEHILPINILAVGETVKLRSDCIREAAESADGDALRLRDIRDLALVLLQALTLDRNPDRVLKPAPNSPSLPAPFREIIANGLSNRWNLSQIANALGTSAPAPLSAAVSSPAAAKAVPDAPTPQVHTPAATPVRRPSPTPIAPAAASAPVSPRTNGNGSSASPAAVLPSRASAPALPSSRSRVEPERFAEHETDPEDSNRRPLVRAIVRASAAIAALLVLVVILWRVTHHAPNTTPPVQTLASMGQPKVSAAAKPSANSPERPIASPSPLARPMAAPSPVARPVVATTASPASASNLHWRVIAFTYNRADQAQTKADRIAQRNPDLHLEVFSPRGHAPYLVAVGGFMSQEDASALRDKLRGRGFPHDIYAQNYGGR
jgi:eukaryotic-like serine/threonine-protein kinase